MAFCCWLRLTYPISTRTLQWATHGDVLCGLRWYDWERMQRSGSR
jgi:hypothetical protein